MLQKCLNSSQAGQKTLENSAYQALQAHLSAAPRYVLATGLAWRACLAGRDVRQNEAPCSFFGRSAP